LHDPRIGLAGWYARCITSGPETIMTYLLGYLLTGAAVAAVMALVQRRGATPSSTLISAKLLLGLYALVALAWPVSVVSIVHGAVLARAVDHPLDR
jgi:hypothetical protein